MKRLSLLTGFFLSVPAVAGGSVDSGPASSIPQWVVCAEVGRPALLVTVKNERGQVLARLTDMEGWNDPGVKM